MDRYRKAMAAGAAALALLAAGSGREALRMDGTGGGGTAQAREAGGVPPIDREVPARVETATFAVG